MPLGRGARLTAKVNCRQVCGRNRRPAQNKFCLSPLKSRITSTKNKLRGNKVTTQFMVEVTVLAAWARRTIDGKSQLPSSLR